MRPVALAISAIILLALLACGDGPTDAPAPTATNTPLPTPTNTPTPEPTNTPTTTPTATPTPTLTNTPTPAPTNTPTPAPTNTPTPAPTNTPTPAPTNTPTPAPTNTPTPAPTNTPTPAPTNTPTPAPTNTPTPAPTNTPTPAPTNTPEPTATLTPQPTPTPTLSSDRTVLISLYHTTDGPNWIESGDWLSDRPIGEWYGVATDDDGRVIELHLDDNQLKGKIPAELGSLSNLQSLGLGDNQLSGSIPEELGSLAKLKTLVLGGNELSGPIPAELGDLSNLQWLSLDRNELSGPIPEELGSLANLLTLDFDYNQLSGPIPTELGSLSSLQRLGLWANELSGQIPAELVGLANLQTLDLSGNELSGQIPAELGELSNLRWLGLGYNRLSGPIPPELRSLSNLQTLNLKDNELSGEMPAGLGGLPNLQFLSLDGNELSGPIPVELGSLSNLQSLYLDFNQLSGGIPAELGSLSSLQNLWLHSNQLSGGIPAELGNLSNLQNLNLNGNRLSGEIPAELGSLSNLERIDLSGNSTLSGPLPESLTGLTSLRTLSLDGTALCTPEDDGFQAWLQCIETKSGVVNCVGSDRGPSPTPTHTPSPTVTHAPTPTAKLADPDGTPGTVFGWSVSASADAIAVGAPAWGETVNAPGAVYVFTAPFLPSEGDVAELTSPGEDEGNFGWSVSLTSDTIAIGAPGLTRGTGAAYIFARPDEGWESTSKAAKLTSPRGEADKFFGNSVSVGSETVAVGAIRENEPGSLYLFEKPGRGAWQSTSDAIELTATDTENSSYFGWSVAFSDDVLVVGMPQQAGAGAAYLYSRPPDGWASVSDPIKLTAPGGCTGHMFGASVAIDGDTVVVGAAGYGESPKRGAAYVFTKPAEGWSSTSDAVMLVPPVRDQGDWFGWSVAVSGDVVVVGANDAYNSGYEAYLFAKPLGGWGTATIKPVSFALEPSGNYAIGSSVAVVDNRLVLASSSETSPGAVYIFENVLDE